MKNEACGPHDGVSPDREIRVSPFEDGWTVSFSGAYYSCPFTKERAIEKAIEIASDASRQEISIMNAEGEVDCRMLFRSSGGWVRELR